MLNWETSFASNWTIFAEDAIVMGQSNISELKYFQYNSNVSQIWSL